jgi:membrane-bound lytic murein transglycosylase MltF
MSIPFYQRFGPVLLAPWLLLSLPTQVFARSLAEIEKTAELRLCLSPVHPSIATAEPGNCRERCQFSGPAFEEVQAFAHSLGSKIHTKWLRVNWDEQFFNKEGQTVRNASYTPELLASGKCDIFPNHLTKTGWRLQKMAIITLMPSRMMVLTQPAKKAGFQSMTDLAGKLVAVEKDTSYHSWIEQQNHISFAANPIRMQLMHTESSVMAVETGKADFTIIDAEAAIWSTRQLKNTVVAFPVGDSDELGWGMRREDNDLQAAVQAFFERQRKNPESEINRIWKKYYGRSLTEFIALMAAVK